MGRIVVGVDGSAGSRAAFRWAVDEAARRHDEVDAINAWSNPAMAVDGSVAVLFEVAEVEASAARLLDEVVASEPTGARVNPIVVEGRAAGVLLEAAVGAELLVVGSRGNGGFTGLLLGSVSQHCARHAPCPVVVVRA